MLRGLLNTFLKNSSVLHYILISFVMFTIFYVFDLKLTSYEHIDRLGISLVLGLFFGAFSLVILNSNFKLYSRDYGLFLPRVELKYREKQLFPFFLVVLLLITSPAHSLLLSTKVLGFYFPNEKIALLLVVVFFVISERRTLALFLLENKYLFLSLFILFLLLLFRLFSYDHFIISDFNIVVSAGSVLLYTLFFLLSFGQFKKAFAYTLLIQILIGLTQLALYWWGSGNSHMLLHNHPMQVGYNFTYRVSGLFMEASQFASFLFLGILIFLKEKSRYLVVLTFLSGFVLFINNSLIAYFLLLAFFIIEFRKAMLLIPLVIGFLVVDSFTVQHFTGVIIQNFHKLHDLFDLSPDNTKSERMILGLKKLNDMMQSERYFLWGSPNSKGMAGGDIISYYAHSLGLLGFSVYLHYLAKLFFNIRWQFLLYYLILCLTNSPVTAGVNQFFLISFFLIEHNSKSS